MKKLVVAIVITIMFSNISFACENDIKDLLIASDKIDVTIDALIRCNKIDKNNLAKDINGTRIELTYISKSLAREYNNSKNEKNKIEISKAFCVVSLYNLVLDECDSYITNRYVNSIREAINSKKVGDEILREVK
jgi:hypothetical protein